jgi:hypothetical protein
MQQTLVHRDASGANENIKLDNNLHGVSIF